MKAKKFELTNKYKFNYYSISENMNSLDEKVNGTSDAAKEGETVLLAFSDKRHTETIEGVNAITQTWRMKERVRYNCNPALLNS
jgi:hypothetical protein